MTATDLIAPEITADPIAGRTIHPAAARFPLITGDEFAQLVESIRERGLDNPVVLTVDGAILDGRNRLRACLEAGIEPHFSHYGGSDPVDYVRRANLRRRDLTPSQRAAIEVDLSEMDAQAAAKARQREAGRSSAPGRPAEKGLAPGPDLSVRAVDEMADRAGVGAKTISRAARVKREDPDLFEKIRNGEVTAKTAERQIIERQPVSPEKRPSGVGRNKLTEKERIDAITDLAGAHLTSPQIAKELGLGVEHIRREAHRLGIEIEADKVMGKTRGLDPNRLVGETVSTLEGVAHSLDLLGDDLTGLDVEQVPYWVASLSGSIPRLKRLINALKELPTQ